MARDPAIERVSAWLNRWPPYALPSTVFAVSVALLFSRRPDAFLSPQFYAEDGVLWYARAYEHGALRALFIPDSGYFQVSSMLVAALAQVVPFAMAPLLFAVVAVAVEAAPAAFLVSRRAATLVPSTAVRVGVAFLYLALPNTWTNSVVVTYAPWRLALLAFLVLVAPARSKRAVAFDVGVLVLAGLAGPLVLLMIPVAIVHFVARPAERSYPVLAAIALTSVAQAVCLLQLGATRSQAPLGASVPAFFRLFTSQFVYGLVLGQSEYPSAVAALPEIRSVFITIPIGLLAIALLAYAATRGPYALRLFVIYTATVLVATLRSAMVAGGDQWLLLSEPGAGTRYFLFGVLAVAVSLVWLAASGPVALRVAACATLGATLVVGVRHDWRHPALWQHDFAADAARFEAAPPGERVEIPVAPPGWTMVLVKR